MLFAALLLENFSIQKLFVVVEFTIVSPVAQNSAPRSKMAFCPRLRVALDFGKYFH